MVVLLELSFIFFLIHYVIFPGSNIHLLISWMPLGLKTSWVIMALYGILWVWFVLALLSILAFILICAAGYGSVFVPIVCSELVKGKKGGYRTKGVLRLLPKHLTMEYRKIEILQQTLNERLGYTLISFGGLIGETVVLSNFVLLTRWDELDSITAAVFIFLASAVTIGWVPFLELFGIYNERGKELLESWKLSRWSSKRIGLWIGKFVKSCRSLGMRSKEFFCIDRMSCLKFVQAIVVGTLSVILTKHAKFVSSIIRSTNFFFGFGGDLEKNSTYIYKFRVG
jgi:hypothetical protein